MREKHIWYPVVGDENHPNPFCDGVNQRSGFADFSGQVLHTVWENGKLISVAIENHIPKPRMLSPSEKEDLEFMKGTVSILVEQGKKRLGPFTD